VGRPLRTLGALLLCAALSAALPRVLNPYVFQILILCGINVILAVSLNLVNGFTGQFPSATRASWPLARTPPPC